MREPETPRYRVTADKAVIGGKLFSRGAETEFAGWPGPELDPINDAAQLVVAYHRTHGNSPTCPDRPYNQTLGSIYLPAELKPSAPEARNTEQGARRASPVTEGVTDDMPKYRARHGMRLGKFRIEEGTSFWHLGWPEEGMDPVNEPAREVEAYYAGHRGHPELLPSPFCLFRQAIVLPKLPALPEVRQRLARHQVA